MRQQGTGAPCVFVLIAAENITSQLEMSKYYSMANFAMKVSEKLISKAFF